ncbi:cation diffusion facilitator family transporter [Rhizobium tumorigenes]|uniref:Cation diffusion facilitator family transporter n=1 Tax=Rhizobium tumorigenes TaxID=2041385 RepID=A0AAF1KPN4_9HYPH|nr:cation diffusion facilitator family transporter [Rhizobium tumorigenes]WFR95382.1 cation diffusion facilitator family transporter [Rhizobium tumorigenes]WFS00863.1 cation diffusion facilitator family transporter [Rhizobium tumorigenes]
MAHDNHHHDHSHDHAHDSHSHASGLGHSHAPANFGKAFAVGVGLNIAFVLVEVIYGIASNSVSLLADAGHNLSDALGLGVAWAAVILAKRSPTQRFTFGLGGSSILAALFNAVFLLVVVGGLSWEAIGRIFEPQPVAGKTVMIVAACGIAINGFCAWLFSSGGGDLNVRGAFMHMAADALVSLGVVIGGLLILLTGWHWIDPVMSVAINVVIIVGTWSLLTGSITMTLNAVPAGIDMVEVRTFLGTLPGVASVHDLHVWSLSTTDTALTCHLVTPAGHPGDEVLEEAARGLQRRFGIGHATFQPELDRCSLENTPHQHI